MLLRIATRTAQVGSRTTQRIRAKYEYPNESVTVCNKYTLEQEMVCNLEKIYKGG